MPSGHSRPWSFAGGSVETVNCTQGPNPHHLVIGRFELSHRILYMQRKTGRLPRCRIGRNDWQHFRILSSITPMLGNGVCSLRGALGRFSIEARLPGTETSFNQRMSEAYYLSEDVYRYSCSSRNRQGRRIDVMGKIGGFFLCSECAAAREDCSSTSTNTVD